MRAAGKEPARRSFNEAWGPVIRPLNRSPISKGTPLITLSTRKATSVNAKAFPDGCSPMAQATTDERE